MVIVSSKATLQPLEWLALQLVGKQASDSRGDVPVGKNQEVDILVRIQGKIDVSPDGTTTKRTTVGPTLEQVLAHVCKRMPLETWMLIEQAIKAEAAANEGACPCPRKDSSSG